MFLRETVIKNQCNEQNIIRYSNNLPKLTTSKNPLKLNFSKNVSNSKFAFYNYMTVHYFMYYNAYLRIIKNHFFFVSN